MCQNSTYSKYPIVITKKTKNETMQKYNYHINDNDRDDVNMRFFPFQDVKPLCPSVRQCKFSFSVYLHAAYVCWCHSKTFRSC